MKWISVKDKLPEGPGIIVAIMNGFHEEPNDPIENALIVILRNYQGKWRTLDCATPYYLPGDEYEDCYYSDIIKYWIPWNEFIFPPSMIIKATHEEQKSSE